MHVVYTPLMLSYLPRVNSQATYLVYYSCLNVRRASRSQRDPHTPRYHYLIALFLATRKICSAAARAIFQTKPFVSTQMCAPSNYLIS